jgi:hypothetical protein
MTRPSSRLTHSSTSTLSPTPTYWDNACSYSLVNNRDLLYNIQPLPSPLHVSGIAGAATATHYGYLHCMPSIHAMNMALLSPSSTINLLSLGYIQRTGGHYFSISTTQTGIRLSSIPAIPTISVTLDPSNLLPVDFDSLTLITRAIASYPTPLARSLFTSVNNNDIPIRVP